LIKFRVRAGDREIPVMVLEPIETHRGIQLPEDGELVEAVRGILNP